MCTSCYIETVLTIMETFLNRLPIVKCSYAFILRLVLIIYNSSIWPPT